ncbi:MAG: AMP-binding protein, partial [bacterium]|nr:AMP-binding protein [bacterium]
DRGKADEIRELRETVKDYKKNPFPVAVPSLFVTTGFVCNEALKYILGIDKPAYNRFFFFNQKGSTRLVETKGFSQMTFPFSPHFRKISKEQGFDWEVGWRDNFVEELHLQSDPACILCGSNGVKAEKAETATRKEPRQAEAVPTEERNKPGTAGAVAALLQQNVHTVTSLLGVLKAAKAYVPLAPGLPVETLSEIIDDSGARVIITDDNHFERAVQLRDNVNKRIPIVNINSIDPAVPDENPAMEITPEMPAYVLYSRDLEDQLEDLQLREYLAGQLPDYMIPSSFVQLEKIPLTNSGKIDIGNLPAPELLTDDHFIPPVSNVEVKLAEIWAEILGLEQGSISLNSNFFESGGHSLRATMLAAKIHKEFDLKVSLAIIFKIPVLGELAQYISEKNREDKYAAIQPVEGEEYYPLSSAQNRLFVLAQVEQQKNVA